MKLFHKQTGQGEALIILHGLYGSSDNWITITKHLSQYFTVYALDMRNHGKSPHSDDHNYDVMSEDVLEFMNFNNIERSILLGHSMGGKTAISFTIKYPEKVSKLIVVDIAPKSYIDKPEYAAYLSFHKNVINTLLSLPLNNYTSRDELFDKMRRPVPEETVRRFLLKNVKRDSEKGFYWQLNLKALEKNLSAIVDGIDPANYKNLSVPDVPTLFLKGENSGYIQQSDFYDIKTLFQLSEIITIPNSGHWLHVEQTMIFVESLLSFLK